MNKQNIFGELPELDNIELQNATYKTHSFAPHFHEEYAIGVFLKGSQKKYCRRSTYIIPEGSICVINPGEIHHGCSIDQNGWTYRMLYLGTSLVKWIAKQIFEKNIDYPFFPDLVIKDNKLFNMIVRLHLTFEQPEVSLLEKETVLFDVMEQLILRYSDVPPGNFLLKSANKYVKHVKEYLDQNYHEDISLSVLSKLAGLSPYYLLRLFKKELGVTPHIYLTNRRISKAKYFLKSGDSLTDVAYKTGFVDQSHFTHRFKNIVGVTPGQYNSIIL